MRAREQQPANAKGDVVERLTFSDDEDEAAACYAAARRAAALRAGQARRAARQRARDARLLAAAPPRPKATAAGGMLGACVRACLDVVSQPLAKKVASALALSAPPGTKLAHSAA